MNRMKRFSIAAALLTIVMYSCCYAITLDDGYVVEWDTVMSYYDHREDCEGRIRSVVLERLNEYWKVDLKECTLTLNDAFLYGEPEREAFDRIELRVKWTAMNGAERTKRMLRMYSDDLAVTLHDAFPDTSIVQLIIFWEVPYLSDLDTIAKYIYCGSRDGMILDSATGILFTLAR